VQGEVATVWFGHDGCHPGLHLQALWCAVLDSQGYSLSHYHYGKSAKETLTSLCTRPKCRFHGHWRCPTPPNTQWPRHLLIFTIISGSCTAREISQGILRLLEDVACGLHVSLYHPTCKNLTANTIALISSAMLAFWVCFFTTTYEGLAAAVGFNIVYVLLRQVFKPITQLGSTDQQKLSELQQSTMSASGLPDTLPDDVRIFRFHESFFFPNAYRLKTAILETIQTHHAPAYSTLHGAEAERNWSVHGERRVARLRKKAGIVDPSTLPPISIVVLDFTKVNHMDATAISHLHSLLKELRLYAGPGVEVRFVGVSKTIRERFERARFTLHDDPWLATDRDDTWTENVPRAYRNLSVAVQAPRRRSSAVLVEKNEKMEHIEEV